METSNKQTSSKDPQKRSGKKFLFSIFIVGIILLLFLFIFLKSPVQAPDQDITISGPDEFQELNNTNQETLNPSDDVPSIEQDLSVTELEQLDSELDLIEGEL